MASGLSPSRVRQAYVLLSAICKAAVESGRIGHSPCIGVHLPKPRCKEQLILTPTQVDALAAACKGYEALVYVLAYGGLRWAEAVGLRKGRVDLLRSRVHIVETLSEVGGHLHLVQPKTYARRYAKLPRWVAEMLAPLCAGGPDELVFTAPRGGPLRDSHFRLRVWRPALRALISTVPANMTHTTSDTPVRHCSSTREPRSRPYRPRSATRLRRSL